MNVYMKSYLSYANISERTQFVRIDLEQRQYFL